MSMSDSLESNDLLCLSVFALEDSAISAFTNLLEFLVLLHSVRMCDQSVRQSMH